MNPKIRSWIASCTSVEQLKTCMNLTDIIPDVEVGRKILNLTCERLIELYPEETIIISWFKNYKKRAA